MLADFKFFHIIIDMKDYEYDFDKENDKDFLREAGKLL